jgi:hypothetical protein
VTDQNVSTGYWILFFRPEPTWERQTSAYSNKLYSIKQSLSVQILTPKKLTAKDSLAWMSLKQLDTFDATYISNKNRR